MGSPGAFPRYYRCTETEGIAQVVVRLCTEHAVSCVFAVSVYTWTQQLRKEKSTTDPVRTEGRGKCCCNGFSMVTFSAQTEKRRNRLPHTPKCTHAYYTFTSCLSHEAPLLCCQLNKHTAAKPTSTPTLTHNSLHYI